MVEADAILVGIPTQSFPPSTSSRSGETGRRAGLKIPWANAREGSIASSGTNSDRSDRHWNKADNEMLSERSRSWRDRSDRH